ncbi:DUF1349 domain-containing protein [Zhouia sp. PK063]|uniref:DUF1349 domain-containing protein n=1 Tax=Zhouia sp. PK063 TaxID=3373602 RepID=UPI0037AD46CB
MKKILICLFVLVLQSMQAQKLEKLNWFNEPDEWHIENNVLYMQVTPKTDYWRKSFYGFTVDDGPFYYGVYGGEFEVKVKLSGAYKSRFDQTGLMLRIDKDHWIKAGVEYVDGNLNVSAVVTNVKSDWSVISVKKTAAIWIKAVRRLDAVELFYSFDDKTYVMYRNAPFQDHHPVKIGMMAASPDGNGFEAKFENFTVRHLPDIRRTEWLKNNE